MTELEEALRTPEELLETLAPRVESLDMLLEYPREVVERFLYEPEGYWTKILSPEDRIAMVDYVRQISFGLAWDIYSQDEYGVMPVETRRAISLHGLLEYCSGIFRQLARLVQLIDRSPNQQLTREKVFVDFSMSRKAGPGSINWLMSHPRSHRFEKAAPNSSLAPNLRGLFSRRDENGEQVEYLPSQISETHVQVDYNTYENRFIRRFLSSMHRDLSTISNLAEVQGAQQVRVDAETLMHGVSELLQYAFLKYSSPMGSIGQASNLHRRPYYHQIYEIYRYYDRIFNFDWSNPVFKLPLRRTWLLYEYWMFFKVIEILKNLGFVLVKDRVTLFFEDADAKLTLELPKGQPSVLELWRESDDALVTMLYSGETVDGTFINPGDGAYHPINPAVFLMSEGKGYVFEVKFKQYTTRSSWHDDLDRLHTYRDALGRDGTVVQEAWCVYPGPGVDGDMETSAPNSMQQPDGSRPGGGVGLVAVHPADESSWQRLEALLRRWFPDLSVSESEAVEGVPEHGGDVDQLQSPDETRSASVESPDEVHDYAEEREEGEEDEEERPLHMGATATLPETADSEAAELEEEERPVDTEASTPAEGDTPTVRTRPLGSSDYPLETPSQRAERETEEAAGADSDEEIGLEPGDGRAES